MFFGTELWCSDSLCGVWIESNLAHAELITVCGAIRGLKFVSTRFHLQTKVLPFEAVKRSGNESVQAAFINIRFIIRAGFQYNFETVNLIYFQSDKWMCEWVCDACRHFTSLVFGSNLKVICLNWQLECQVNFYLQLQETLNCVRPLIRHFETEAKMRTKNFVWGFVREFTSCENHDNHCRNSSFEWMQVGDVSGN